MSFDSEPGSGAEAAPRAPAGWYPVDAINQRYWDGYEWTNHIAPLAAAPTAHRVPPPPGFGQRPGLTNVASSDDRTYALIMHLAGLFVSFLVPLIMWAIKKDESPFVDHHGRQLMNFHFSMWIYMFVSFVLILVFIGILMILALVVLYFVFGIIGAIAANRGEYYRYPAAIPFFK